MSRKPSSKFLKIRGKKVDKKPNPRKKKSQNVTKFQSEIYDVMKSYEFKRYRGRSVDDASEYLDWSQGEVCFPTITACPRKSASKLGMHPLVNYVVDEYSCVEDYSFFMSGQLIEGFFSHTQQNFWLHIVLKDQMTEQNSILSTIIYRANPDLVMNNVSVAQIVRTTRAQWALALANRIDFRCGVWSNGLRTAEQRCINHFHLRFAHQQDLQLSHMARLVIYEFSPCSERDPRICMDRRNPMLTKRKAPCPYE